MLTLLAAVWLTGCMQEEFDVIPRQRRRVSGLALRFPMWVFRPYLRAQ